MEHRGARVPEVRPLSQGLPPLAPGFAHPAQAEASFPPFLAQRTSVYAPLAPTLTLDGVTKGLTGAGVHGAPSYLRSLSPGTGKFRRPPVCTRCSYPLVGKSKVCDKCGAWNGGGSRPRDPEGYDDDDDDDENDDEDPEEEEEGEGEEEEDGEADPEVALDEDVMPPGGWPRLPKDAQGAAKGLAFDPDQVPRMNRAKPRQFTLAKFPSHENIRDWICALVKNMAAASDRLDHWAQV